MSRQPLLPTTAANPKSEPSKQRSIPTVSAILDDGGILEMVHRPSENRSAFVVWQGTQWRMPEQLQRQIDGFEVQVREWKIRLPHLPKSSDSALETQTQSVVDFYSQSLTQFRQIEELAIENI